MKPTLNCGKITFKHCPLQIWCKQYVTYISNILQPNITSILRVQWEKSVFLCWKGGGGYLQVKSWPWPHRHPFIDRYLITPIDFEGTRPKAKSQTSLNISLSVVQLTKCCPIDIHVLRAFCLTDIKFVTFVSFNITWPLLLLSSELQRDIQSN